MGGTELENLLKHRCVVESQAIIRVEWRSKLSDVEFLQSSIVSRAPVVLDLRRRFKSLDSSQSRLLDPNLAR
jgi:hypothetical protein